MTTVFKMSRFWPSGPFDPLRSGPHQTPPEDIYAESAHIPLVVNRHLRLSLWHPRMLDLFCIIFCISFT